MEEQGLHQKIVDRILSVVPDTRRIVLFGSRAKGTHDEESDIDLLVVAYSNLPQNNRAVQLRRALHGIGMPIDIVVVTPEEFERYKTWKSFVVYQALEEGVTLYEAA